MSCVCVCICENLLLKKYNGKSMEFSSVIVSLSQHKPNKAQPNKGLLPRKPMVIKSWLGAARRCFVCTEICTDSQTFQLQYYLTALPSTGDHIFLDSSSASTWTKAEQLLSLKVCGANALLGFNPTVTKRLKETFYYRLWAQIKYKSSQQGIPANCWGVKMVSQIFGKGVLWKDYEHLISFLLSIAFRTASVWKSLIISWTIVQILLTLEELLLAVPKNSIFGVNVIQDGQLWAL